MSSLNLVLAVSLAVPFVALSTFVAARLSHEIRIRRHLYRMRHVPLERFVRK